MANPSRILRNSILNASSWLALMVVNILITPFMVSKLTLEGFGLYVILTSVLAYVTFFDFSLGEAIIKFVSEDFAKGNIRGINLTASSALTAQVFIAVLLAVILVAVSESIVGLLGVSPNMKEQAIAALRITSCGFPFALFASSAGNLPIALQRFDLSSAIALISGLLNFVGVIVLLVLGFGLKELVFWNIMAIVAGGLMSLLAMKRMIPRFSLRPQFDVSTLSRLMSFSLYSQAAKVAALVSESVSRILVGFMLGPVAVSFFAIPLRALATFQGIAVRLSRVIFPVAADLVARNEAERLRIVFRKSSRYLMLFVTPIFVWLGVFSRQILTLWMGEDFAEQSWLIMTIGSVAYWMVCWSLVPSNIAFGLGNAKINATFSVLVGATNLILIIFLSKVFGVVGAALALLIVQVQTPFFVYLISSRLLKSDGIQDLRTSYLLPSISGLSCVPFAIFINPTSFIGLLGSAIVVVILFVAILFLLRVVHKEEAKYLIGLLSLKNLRRERF